MEYISLEDTLKLKDSEKILVNRVRINSILVILEHKQPSLENNEKQKILLKAIRNLHFQEKLKGKIYALFGPLMIVEDIRKVFGNEQDLPGNTFALPVLKRRKYKGEQNVR